MHNSLGLQRQGFKEAVVVVTSVTILNTLISNTDHQTKGHYPHADSGMIGARIDSRIR